MYQGKHVRAIVSAAGRGSRFGGPLPKQFLKIEGGRTVLETALQPFQQCNMVDEILVVANQDFVMLTRELCETYDKVKAVVVPKGPERQDSVRAALEAITNMVSEGALAAGEELVLIHDGARPYVTADVIQRVIEAAEADGAAVPAVPVKDTIRQTVEGGSRTLDRSTLHSVQTPQGFCGDLLRKAFAKAYEDEFYGTDDASLVERLDWPVTIVKGDYANLKITTPEDLPQSRPERPARPPRIGSGYDVHRLVPDRKLILCGVEIPHTTGLLGHSDADVALHALMDALLGAASLGDIGKHFPDTDPQYKGISSMKLLEHVKGLLDDRGYTVGNVDVTIIAQKPKLLPFIPTMRENVAKALGIDLDCVNVKATTTEKLGFAGREEGIASEAVCILL